eukprot:FR736661.1.p1 GENE.FR736661.1~~FR736661.1.p1  ORF type:complete len:127 (+),score=55.60 FR736661.1:852-1232(+)
MRELTTLIGLPSPAPFPSGKPVCQLALRIRPNPGGRGFGNWSPSPLPPPPRPPLRPGSFRCGAGGFSSPQGAKSVFPPKPGEYPGKKICEEKGPDKGPETLKKAPLVGAFFSLAPPPPLKKNTKKN